MTSSMTITSPLISLDRSIWHFQPEYLFENGKDGIAIIVSRWLTFNLNEIGLTSQAGAKQKQGMQSKLQESIDQGGCDG